MEMIALILANALFAALMVFAVTLDRKIARVMFELEALRTASAAAAESVEPSPLADSLAALMSYGSSSGFGTAANSEGAAE